MPLHVLQEGSQQVVPLKTVSAVQLKQLILPDPLHVLHSGLQARHLLELDRYVPFRQLKH